MNSPSPSQHSVVCYTTDDVFLEHDMPTHPERADRLRAVHARLTAGGLLQRMQSVPPTPAPRAWLTRVHDPAYLDWLEEQRPQRPHYVERDTYLGPSSYRVARLAVGGTVLATEAVLSGRARSGLALVRPPGHHALRDQPMGFCLLNNVACAAAYALEEGGLSRVLIFDFDAHHGNGTQEAFWEDPRVLYVSIHQRPLFPGSGAATERGAGAGTGYTVNLPLPPGSGDSSLDYLVSSVVGPLADSFRPELVMLSAGYDAHWRDPLTGLSVSLSGFTALAESAVAIATRHCRGRLLAALEGGYDHEALAVGVANLAEVLLGTPDRCIDPVGPPPTAALDDLDRLERLREMVLA